jgi:hypothetical protein
MHISILGKRLKVGDFYGQSYISWLDELPKEDIFDDPEYEPPSNVKERFSFTPS